MIRRLEDFARMLGMELQAAQESSQHAWPGTRISQMNIDLAATVEQIGGSRVFALRVGRPRFRKASLHQVTIELADEIAIRFDGKLLWRYEGGSHAATV